MDSKIDVTKLPGYRPEWEYRNKPPTPQYEGRNTVPKVISPYLARKISAAYVCAACWEPLEIFWHIEGEFKGQYTIECEFCGGNVPGFVTRTYVHYRIIENNNEYDQAKIALAAVVPFWFTQDEAKIDPIPATPKNRETNLKELGF